MYSNEKWGFDFCVDEFMSSSAGAYVFEDTFEMWTTENVSSNAMASARWDHVTNGRLSDICGVGNGAGTMTFSGANFREVETLDVDMRCDRCALLVERFEDVILRVAFHRFVE